MNAINSDISQPFQIEHWEDLLPSQTESNFEDPFAELNP